MRCFQRPFQINADIDLNVCAVVSGVLTTKRMKFLLCRLRLQGTVSCWLINGGLV